MQILLACVLVISFCREADAQGSGHSRLDSQAPGIGRSLPTTSIRIPNRSSTGQTRHPSSTQARQSIRLVQGFEEEPETETSEFDETGPFIPVPGQQDMVEEPEPQWALPEMEESGHPLENNGPVGRSSSSADRTGGSGLSFWVVSSRDCPQAGSPCLADQKMTYYFRTADGRMLQRSSADFYRSVNPQVPMCVMVHGSLMRWEQMLREGQETFIWLKKNSPQTPFQFVLFTWPSERPLAIVAPIDFSILGKQSGYNGFYLGRMLSRLPADMPVSLIGHSHGARVVVSALHLTGGGDMYGYRLATQTTGWPRMRGVLAAAALDHHWLDPGQRYGQALVNSESIVNLRNGQDYALILYPLRLPLGRQPLGLVGFNWYDRRLLGTQYGKIRDVDVTSLIHLGHIWPRFYEHPEIAQTLAPYIFYQDDLPPMLTLNRRGGFLSERQSINVAKPAPRTRQNQPALVRGQLPMSPPTASSKQEQELLISPGHALTRPQPRGFFHPENAARARP